MRHATNDRLAGRELRARAGSLVGSARIVLALLPALAALALAPAAGANHIPGATYAGTHSGGGTLEFTVAADGGKLTNLKVSEVPPCNFGLEVFEPGFAANSIVNHAFAYTGATKLPNLSFSGSFPGAQSAQGTLQYSRSFPSCTTPTYAWSATTSASPPPGGDGPGADEPGADEPGSDDCKRATTKLKKAKKKLKTAHTARAKEKAAKKVKKAKRRKRAAC